MYVLYYIYIYSGSPIRAWPMLTANIDLTGQSIVHALNMYIPFAFNSYKNCYHYKSPTCPQCQNKLSQSQFPYFRAKS